MLVFYQISLFHFNIQTFFKGYPKFLSSRASSFLLMTDDLYLQPMPMFLPHVLQHNKFLVTAGRSIFWEDESALIVSDLHLGKSGHFRKSGIAIPQAVLVEDMQRLVAQIQFYKPSQLIVVGDLFHSDANREHDLFLKWRNDLAHITVHLVKGNHDILKESWYREANIIVHKHVYTVGNFSFIHDINDCDTGEMNYCFSGHVHPGITIKGPGRQALRLSCFYFGKKYAILPAFGKFTGTYTLEPGREDAVFGLVGNKVMRIQ
jgi:DNA ligase-associated metallophosphoesterase